VNLKLVTLTYKQIDALNDAASKQSSHGDDCFGLKFIKHLPSSQLGGGFLYKIIDEKRWVFTKLQLGV